MFCLQLATSPAPNLADALDEELPVIEDMLGGDAFQRLVILLKEHFLAKKSNGQERKRRKSQPAGLNKLPPLQIDKPGVEHVPLNISPAVPDTTTSSSSTAPAITSPAVSATAPVPASPAAESSSTNTGSELRNQFAGTKLTTSESFSCDEMVRKCNRCYAVADFALFVLMQKYHKLTVQVFIAQVVPAQKSAYVMFWCSSLRAGKVPPELGGLRAYRIVPTTWAIANTSAVFHYLWDDILLGMIRNNTDKYVGCKQLC